MSAPANPQPPAILIGAPPWSAEAARLLRDAGLSLQHVHKRGEYLDRLVAAHPALVLVDGSVSDWEWWVTTPKVRQETRRIPLVVVGPDPDQAAAALRAGADAFLSAQELAARLPGAIRAMARLPDPARQARLLDQCGEPMPPPGLEGIARFNAGEYYAQHDLFEALWIAEPGPVRDLYRAILQVGVAYHQITRGNPRGALKMLRRSAQWFASLPDTCRGVDVRQLRADAAAVEAALQAMLDAGRSDFDATLLAPIRFADERS